MPKAKQSAKRILKVVVKRMLDDSPDTSWLGEYSNRATSEYSIDRAHSEDCASVNPRNEEARGLLDRIAEHLNSTRIDSELDTPADEIISESIATCNDLIEQIGDCDCGERGDMERGEYRYFNPSFNYVNKAGKPTDGLTPEDVRKYTRQDYERMESLNACDWYFMGIKAEAEIGIPDNPLDMSNQCYTVQRIHSGGLWGIESDSERSSIEEEEKNQLAELRAQLKALGFSTRAISAAFKNVEREDA